MNRKKLVGVLVAGATIVLSMGAVHAQEVVTIPDETLEAILRGEIGKPKGPIYKDDLKVVTRIVAAEQGIQSLEGLQYCVNLRGADLRWNEISYIPDLSTLDELEYLQLDGNLISDISGLSSLGNIKALHIGGNGIPDISPLANLTTLERLEIGGGEISDISALSELTSLRWVDLRWNCVSDISPLSDLAKLTELRLRNNNITDLSPLTNLTNLNGVYLENNSISNIYPLVENPGIDEGDEVIIANNPLNETSIEEYIPKLKERGVTVGWQESNVVETMIPESPTGTTPPETASPTSTPPTPEKDNTPLYLGVIGILIVLVLAASLVRRKQNER